MSLLVQEGKLQIDVLKGGATDQFSSETSPGKYGSCSNPRRIPKMPKRPWTSTPEKIGGIFEFRSWWYTFRGFIQEHIVWFWGFDGDFPRNSWVSVSPDQYLPPGKLLCLVMDVGAVGAL